jgi:hypothetical protein
MRILKLTALISTLLLFVACEEATDLTGPSEPLTETSDNNETSDATFASELFAEYTIPTQSDLVGNWEFVSEHIYQQTYLDDAFTITYDTTSYSYSGDMIPQFTESAVIFDGGEYPYTLNGSEMIFYTYPQIEADSSLNGATETESYHLFMDGDTLLLVWLYNIVLTSTGEPYEWSTVEYEALRLVRGSETYVPDYSNLPDISTSDILGEWVLVEEYDFEAIYGETGILYSDGEIDNANTGLEVSFTETELDMDGITFEYELDGNELSYYMYPQESINSETGITSSYKSFIYIENDTLNMDEVSEEVFTDTGSRTGNYSVSEYRFIRQ